MPKQQIKRMSDGLFDQKLFKAKPQEWMTLAVQEARRARQNEITWAKTGQEALSAIQALISSNSITTHMTPEEKKLVDKLTAMVAYVENVDQPEAVDPWRGE